MERVTNNKSELETELLKMAKEAGSWETIKTQIPGVFLVRPGNNKKLLLMLNPPDKEGNPTKRKGVYISNLKMLEFLKDIIKDEKVFDLALILEKLFGTKKTRKKDRIIQI